MLRTTCSSAVAALVLVVAPLSHATDALPHSHARSQSASARAPDLPPITVQPQAIGEVGKDVVYTPIPPCRVFDTRASQGGAGPLVVGTLRTYTTQGDLSLNQQGGNAAGCGVPLSAAAVQLQMSPVFPPGIGWITGNAQGQTINPGAALLTYNTGDLNTSSAGILLNQTNGQFSIQAYGAGTELVGDAVGYFIAPTAGNGLRVIQTTGTYTDAPNIINGSANNSASGQAAIVAGGGSAGSDCFDPFTLTYTRPCGNRATNNFATVGGGRANLASGNSSAVAGGGSNNASGDYSTVAGGNSNVASAVYSTVGGGSANDASGSGSTVAGGSEHTASGDSSTVGGGIDHSASGDYSTVAGGYQNTASGSYSTVGGGNDNCAGGVRSWAGGRQAKVRPGTDSGTPGSGCVFVALSGDADGDEGTFAWADSQAANFVSTGANRFLVRALGGVWFGTTSAPAIAEGRFLDTSTGAGLTAGGVWTNSSDRNLKENFTALNAKEVLAKVMALPVTLWNYKSEPATNRHIGPVAQDFKRLFGVGADDTSIGTVDASGVALAAIQGLNQIVQEKDREIAALRKKLEAIEKKLGL